MREEEKILNFLLEAFKLKDVERTGWVEAKIKNPESVADHSWGVALLALILSKRVKLNLEKCLKMALIHDINEIYTKDIALQPEDRGTIKEKKKKKIERNAMKKVLSFLPNSIKRDWERVWNELEARKTREAKVVRNLDKLDMAIQALIYKKRTKKDLSLWIKDANNLIKLPEIRKIFEVVKMLFKGEKNRL
jgi:5'-deoxynucleotidase YfbR-like HD superfamily hydrolase